MEYICNYIIGLFVIGLVVQPWFVGVWIGLDMDLGALSYIVAVIVEIIGLFIILLPYIIGKIFTTPRL